MKTADVSPNEVIDAAALAGTPLGDCHRAYEEMLDRYHVLTFGQLVARAVRALEDPAIHAKVHGTLRHLVVDEYQDINPAQQRLIDLLTQEPVNLCVVGDDDQAIYQWRGSDVRNIQDFARHRPGTRSITLDENRRCRPRIVRTADAFAATLPGRLPKTMRPVRVAAEPEIVPWAAETDVDEGRKIADTMERLKATGLPVARDGRALPLGAHVGAAAARRAEGAPHPVHVRGPHGAVPPARHRLHRRVVRVAGRRRLEGRAVRAVPEGRPRQHRRWPRCFVRERCAL